jgi:hypothetical protein
MRPPALGPHSSTAPDRPVRAMSWQRRRIRRARRRGRELAPQPLIPASQAPTAGGPSIRRLVVFVPRAPRAPRALSAVTPLARPATAPVPA